MINKLIEWSLNNRILIVALYLGLAGWGYWALLYTPIDAIPDLSDNQVIVFTDWAGRSPQEVEDQVTYPLVTSLQGLPGVRVVRANSAFSFSMVNVIFEDDVDLYWARTRVLERLNLVSKQLPEGVTPAGNCFVTRFNRSKTRVRAQYKSTLSSKMTFTIEKLNAEFARTVRTPGSPCRFVTSGYVT